MEHGVLSEQHSTGLHGSTLSYIYLNNDRRPLQNLRSGQLQVRLSVWEASAGGKRGGGAGGGGGAEKKKPKAKAKAAPSAAARR